MHVVVGLLAPRQVELLAMGRAGADEDRVIAFV